jgi:hypothetical protein
VVLTSRRWRQVLRSCVGPTGLRQNISADDGGKRARSPGRARHKPLKPLRAGMPGDSGVRSTNTKCTRDRGCSGHPAFPTPALGREIQPQLGRIAPRDREVVCGIGADTVIPGRCEASNPESRDSPMRNCASEVWSCGPSRNDGVWIARHCERSEAMHSRFFPDSRLLRGACHRARIRATRWLAMTLAVRNLNQDLARASSGLRRRTETPGVLRSGFPSPALPATKSPVRRRPAPSPAGDLRPMFPV